MKRTLLTKLVLALMVVFAFTALPVLAQEDDVTDYPVNTITVSGTGSASGAPDIANLNVGVRTVDPNVDAALTQNNQAVEAVINALTELGIAREDVRTTNINVFRREDFNRPGPPPMPAEGGMQTEGEPQEPPMVFEVTNDLQVVVRDTSLVADVIAAAVNAGANNIYGLNFSIEDRAALESEARREAVNDAQRRAQELAELIGAELGEAIVVAENASFGGPGPFPAAFEQARGGGGVPVEPGQLSVTSSVQITYRINR